MTDINSGDVENYPDGFHSGDHHVLTDPPRNEPDVLDPSQWCYECGNKRSGHCGVCGMPLCHRHHETGGGYCSDRTIVDTRIGPVPACVRPAVEGGLEVSVDAPAVNYQRPERQRLPPSEIEQAVRDRLPGQLVERAFFEVKDAILAADNDDIPKDVVWHAVVAEDRLREATARHKEELLAHAHDRLERALEACEDDQAFGVGMDLSTAKGLLEQLGADRGDSDE